MDYTTCSKNSPKDCEMEYSKMILYCFTVAFIHLQGVDTQIIRGALNSCETAKCAAGFKCEMHTPCATPPCRPMARCVPITAENTNILEGRNKRDTDNDNKTTPATATSPTQLTTTTDYPATTDVSHMSPKCGNIDCLEGRHCVMKPVKCLRAPCDDVPTCAEQENHNETVRSCKAIRCIKGHCIMKQAECDRHSRQCYPIATCENNDNNSPCQGIQCTIGTVCKVVPSCAGCPPVGQCVPGPWNWNPRDTMRHSHGHTMTNDSNDNDDEDESKEHVNSTGHGWLFRRNKRQSVTDKMQQIFDNSNSNDDSNDDNSNSNSDEQNIVGNKTRGFLASVTPSGRNKTITVPYNNQGITSTNTNFGKRTDDNAPDAFSSIIGIPSQQRNRRAIPTDATKQPLNDNSNSNDKSDDENSNSNSDESDLLGNKTQNLLTPVVPRGRNKRQSVQNKIEGIVNKKINSTRNSDESNDVSNSNSDENVFLDDLALLSGISPSGRNKRDNDIISDNTDTEQKIPGRCGPGEVMRKCKPCEQTCGKNGIVTPPCTKICIRGCSCRKGFVRNSSGQCIPKAQCPVPIRV